MGEFFIDSEGVLLNYIGTEENVVIPSNVKIIRENAFYLCKRLTSITIPDGVICIGDAAFSLCSSLTSITIPDSVISIGTAPFNACDNLTEILVANGNNRYDSRNNCNAIIDKVTNCLIAGCSTTIIPDGVTSIGNAAFQNCIDLKSITIPSSVTTIGSHAFCGCSSLTSITIPDGVTSIGSGTFLGCTNLKSITIPSSVSTIESTAFCCCSSLTSITIPDGVTSIEISTFSNCTNLKSITIPSSVSTIEYEAFSDCSSLTSITIPSSVSTIGYKAFSHCSSLTSITIPDSVISIDDSAFEECNALNSIVTQTKLTKTMFGSSLPQNPLYTNDISFLPRDLKPLAAVSFIQNYDNADENRSKSHLKYIKENVEKLMPYAMQYKNLLLFICENKFLKSANFEKYMHEAQKQGNAEIIAILLEYKSNNIKNGTTDLFKEKKKSLTEIKKEWAFEDNESGITITSYKGSDIDIEIPSSICAKPVTKIGKYAFSPKKARLKNTVAEFRETIRSVIIPEGVTEICENAFCRCTKLTSITIPDSVTSIGEAALYWCQGLTSITIPDSVTSIGNLAFANERLTSIIYNGTIEQWNAITKGSRWQYSTGPYTTIHCTDGDVVNRWQNKTSPYTSIHCTDDDIVKS